MSEQVGNSGESKKKQQQEEERSPVGGGVRERKEVRFADVEEMASILPGTWGEESSRKICGFLDRVRLPTGSTLRPCLSTDEAKRLSRNRRSEGYGYGFGPFWVHADLDADDPSKESNTCRSWVYPRLGVRGHRRCRRRVQDGCVYCFQHAFGPEHVSRRTVFADGNRGGAVRGRWESKARQALKRSLRAERKIHESRDYRNPPRTASGYALSVPDEGEHWTGLSLVGVPEGDAREGSPGLAARA